jgi:hypothetical protein
MPVKRRASKRRLDVRGELDAWQSTFDAGVTFDGDLECVGIAGDPTLDQTAEAWQRLGARFIAERGRETDTGATHWALQQFGEPPHGR